MDETISEQDILVLGSDDVSMLLAGQESEIIRNISLRDHSPETILSSENIVDDVDHVCREKASIHLAEQVVGHRAFIRCALADLLEGQMALAQNELKKIFSPFGLGILDIALGEYVLQLELKHGSGMALHSFLPS